MFLCVQYNTIYIKVKRYGVKPFCVQIQIDFAPAMQDFKKYVWVQPGLGEWSSLSTAGTSEEAWAPGEVPSGSGKFLTVC